jgi:hypothetical protein
MRVGTHRTRSRVAAAYRTRQGGGGTSSRYLGAAGTADTSAHEAKIGTWKPGEVGKHCPEIGRRDPAFVRKLFAKHQERILLGTDFQVYDRLTLGSGGDDEPDDAAAATFFKKHWTFFETLERGFPHMTPIQGNWTIDAIGLPAPVLRKIYFDNAARILHWKPSGTCQPGPHGRASRPSPRSMCSRLCSYGLSQSVHRCSSAFICRCLTICKKASAGNP